MTLVPGGQERLCGPRVPGQKGAARPSHGLTAARWTTVAETLCDATADDAAGVAGAKSYSCGHTGRRQALSLRGRGAGVGAQAWRAKRLAGSCQKAWAVQRGPQGVCRCPEGRRRACERKRRAAELRAGLDRARPADTFCQRPEAAVVERADDMAKSNSAGPGRSASTGSPGSHTSGKTKDAEHRWADSAGRR